MSLFQTISDFFVSIFNKSAPEVQKKQLKRKMESEIKAFSPNLYNEGMLLPNFGEAIYALYTHTKTIDDLFLKTISATDSARQHRFEAQLILTGYSPEEQQEIEALSYENKKMQVYQETLDVDKVYKKQRKTHERLLKELNNEDFKKMDKDILALRHFSDFCHYNFLQFLQVFDVNFIPSDFTYKPKYNPVNLSRVINLLEDLYFQLEGLRITTVTQNQINAISVLLNCGKVYEQQLQNYENSLKKINYIISKIITPARLKLLIQLAKMDSLYEPKFATYEGSPRQEFADAMNEKFRAEEQRIKTEYQNEQILNEMSNLFNGLELDSVLGYDNETNSMLMESTNLSFKWVLPFKVLKTFLKIYVSNGIKSLLNDLVIEGFFSNPLYKSNFSSTVFAVCNASTQIKEFEQTFEAGQPNNVAVIQGYIKDSSKDKDFYTKLLKIVDGVNSKAHEIMQTTTTELHTIHKNLGELLADSKKPSSEIISNVKLLMMSSRNREYTNLLEEQYSNWNIFFNIMKSYVIINTADKNLAGRE